MFVVDEKKIIMQVLEEYTRTGSTSNDQVKVTCLPDGKTSLIERNETDSRSIQLKEYRVDGKIIWAGYSWHSGTVYLSTVTSR